MIQFNLLPDVKLDYVKATHTKRLLTLVSVVVSVAALVVMLLAIVAVDVVQKKSLHDLNNDIGNYSSQLKGTPDLNKILTVQNQLSTLTQLHDKKPVSSRLFGYISQLTPQQASLSQLTLDYTTNTLTIGGSAPSLDAVSTYTDTLKAAKYSITGSSTQPKAFNNVVLSSFGRTSTDATFTITCGFDPIIFNSQDNVALIVPNNINSNQSSIFGTGE